MILFGKQFSRKMLIKIALLIFGMCVVISLPIMASLGWFFNNHLDSVTGSHSSIELDTFDIVIDRPLAESFDSSATDSEGNPLYPNITEFKNLLQAKTYSMTGDDSYNDGSVALELVNEYPDALGSYSLRPGSYGYLTFYIRPHDGYDNTVLNLSLAISAYYCVYDALDNVTIEPVTSQSILNILKGHILFFEDRSGADQDHFVYGDLVEEGSFSFDMSEHSKSPEVGRTDCYQLTFYWEWPITYDEILTGIGTKYPSALEDMIDDYPTHFFATNVGSNDRVLLNDGYNDGDQLICDYVDFITLEIR